MRRTRMAISSGAAYSAVDKLVRDVRQTYNPTPALEQVSAEASAEDPCLFSPPAQLTLQGHMPLSLLSRSRAIHVSHLSAVTCQSRGGATPSDAGVQCLS